MTILAFGVGLFGSVARAGDIPPDGRLLLETNRVQITTDRFRTIPLNAPIGKDDLLLLAFTVRGKTNGLSAFAVQIRRQGATYGEYASFPCRLAGDEVQTVFLPFRVRQPTGKLDIRFHSLGAPASFYFDTLSIRNYGSEYPLEKLPQTALQYEGREEDAVWRQAARERIERLRKTDITVRVVDHDGRPVTNAIVRFCMKRHLFRFGTAVTAQLLVEQTPDAVRYRGMVESNFNSAAFENDLKPGPWEQSQSNTDPHYRWEWTDRALTWLHDRNMHVRGHYLVSGRLSPPDFSSYREKPELLRRNIFGHIDNKLPIIGYRVDEWDAVNHVAVLDNSLETIFQSLDIFAEVIRHARSVLPDMPFWVNEGTILPGGLRRNHYENTLHYLMDVGAAPDGIGLMGQFTPAYIENPDDVYSVLERYADLISHLQITELVFSMNEDEALQADYVRDVMTLAFSHPAMEGITLWGFWEGRHPIPQAALLRRDWSAKPAWTAWRRLVFDEWWTNEQQTTGTNGVCAARGFIGEYDITASSGTSAATVPAVIRAESPPVEIRLP